MQYHVASTLECGRACWFSLMDLLLSIANPQAFDGAFCADDCGSEEVCRSYGECMFAEGLQNACNTSGKAATLHSTTKCMTI